MGSLRSSFRHPPSLGWEVYGPEGILIEIPLNHRGKMEDCLRYLECNQTNKDCPPIPTQVCFCVIDFEAERQQAIKRKKTAYKKRRRKRQQLEKRLEKQRKQQQGKHNNIPEPPKPTETTTTAQTAPPQREIRRWDTEEEADAAIQDLFERLGSLLPKLDTIVLWGLDMPETTLFGVQMTENFADFVSWEVFVVLLRQTKHKLKFLRLENCWYGECEMDDSFLPSELQTFELKETARRVGPLFHSITPFLVKRCLCLEHISLSVNIGIRIEYQEVFDALGSSHVLKTLKLDCSMEIGCPGFRALLNAVNANPHSKLEELVLVQQSPRFWDFEDQEDSMQPFLTLLQTNKTLRKLHIPVEWEIVVPMFEALESNRKLNFLFLTFLSRYHFGNHQRPAVAALKKMFQVNATLTQLSYSSCHRDDVGSPWLEDDHQVSGYLGYNKAAQLLQAGENWGALEAVSDYTDQTFRLLCRNPNLVQELVECKKGNRHETNPPAKKYKTCTGASASL